MTTAARIAAASFAFFMAHAPIGTVAARQAPSAPAGWPIAASAPVSVRPHVAVDGSIVRLGDIFDGIDEGRADTALGPAPALGASFVVEAPQLASIARSHGLSWTPLSAGERVVVERAGRPVSRDEVIKAAREAFSLLGESPDAEIELAPFTETMVPPSAPVRLTLDAPTFDAASGRFSGTLSVAADGIPTRRIRVTGRAHATETVVVAARRMIAGEVIGQDDVRLERVRAGRGRGDVARDVSEVLGQRLVRPMASGMPIASADTAEAQAVERNTPVTIVLEAGFLRLTALGRALEAGPVGSTVPVVNLGTRAVVDGEVTSVGTVRVSPGSVPRQIDPQLRARADYALRLDAAAARAARGDSRSHIRR